MVYILISVIFNVLGQFYIKIGATKIGHLNFSLHHILPQIVHMIFFPQIFLGLCLYAISSVFWILALSKADLSYAYPMLSLGYILVLILSAVFLKENITIERAIGVAIIIVGILLVSRSA